MHAECIKTVWKPGVLLLKHNLLSSPPAFKRPAAVNLGNMPNISNNSKYISYSETIEPKSDKDVLELSLRTHTYLPISCPN